jgi:hypothetical protein
MALLTKAFDKSSSGKTIFSFDFGLNEESPDESSLLTDSSAQIKKRKKKKHKKHKKNGIE